MTNKTKTPRYVTPTGVAAYPHLLKPDTKFNPDGDYKVTLRLSSDAVMKDAKGNSLGTVQEFIDAQLKASVEKAKSENQGKIREADPPYQFDENTNELLVTFKLKAKGKTKAGEEFIQKPALFDSKGKPFNGESIWGGSKLKVSFEAVPFYTKLIGAGITLRLKAAQVIELSAGGGGNADAYGFGEEEGYESDEDEADDFKASADDEDEDGTNHVGNGDY